LFFCIDNQITERGARSIAKALHKNKSLKRLLMSGKKILIVTN